MKLKAKLRKFEKNKIIFIWVLIMSGAFILVFFYGLIAAHGLSTRLKMKFMETFQLFHL